MQKSENCENCTENKDRKFARKSKIANHGKCKEILKILGKQLSQQSSRSEFWAFWPQKMPASG